MDIDGKRLWKDWPTRFCKNGHGFKTTRNGIKCPICDLPLNAPKIEKKLVKVC